MPHPFITPSSQQYADVLWDWDSWLTNVALRQILLEAGDAQAQDEARVRTGLYPELSAEEKGVDPQTVLALLHAKSRDNAGTPMQWDASVHAGFTSDTPWIEVNPNYSAINVQQALADPQSIFAYYRQLIRLPKANPVIVYGTYDLILDAHAEIYAFTRTLDDDRLLIILNFTKNTPVFALPTHIAFAGKELLIRNYAVDSAEDISLLTLRPFEARVYRLLR